MEAEHELGCFFVLNRSCTLHKVSDDLAILCTDEQHHIVRGVEFVEVLYQISLGTYDIDLLRNKSLNEQANIFYVINLTKKLGLLVNDLSLKSTTECRILSNKKYGLEKSSSLILFLLDEEYQYNLKLMNEELLGLLNNLNSILIITDSYLNPNLPNLINSISDDRRVCIAKVIGSEIWVGPLLPANSTIWSTLFERIYDNFATEHYIAIATKRSPTGSRENSELNITLANDIIISELKTLINLSNIKSNICSNILTYYSTDNRCKLHSIEYLRKIDINPSKATKKIESFDGGKRLVSPAEIIKFAAPLIDSITGLIPGLHPVENFDGSYVTTTLQVYPNAYLLKENRKIGSRFAAAGKGESIEQSMASCIGEAIERYSTCFQGNEKLFIGSFQQLSNKAIDPRLLMQFSESQYERRDWWNSSFGHYHYVPVKFDETVPMCWITANRVIDGEPLLVPASYTYFNFFEHHTAEPKFCIADSNGCAAGITITEASLQGLYELIERDACAIWWYNRLHLSTIELNNFKSQFINKVKDRYKTYGRNVSLLDLTNDLQIPVVLAVSYKFNGTSICVGLGCNWDGEIAASRAIAELDQFVAMIGLAELNGDKDSENPDLDKWLREESISKHSYFIGKDHCSIPQAYERTPLTIDDEWLALVDRIEQLVGPVYRVDLSRPEAGLKAVRIIAPGLRHFWARFASGRLYEVPVIRGQLLHMLSEEELNPIPFFL